MGKYTIEDMNEIAQKRQGKCLSTVYINHRTPLLWECAKGHHWEATPSTILKGFWCPVDRGIRLYSIEDLKDFAEKHGGECLSDQYINRHEILLWRCKHGHVWKAPWSAVIKGAWCPTDAGLSSDHYIKEKYSINNLKVLAESRNGKCLSDVYKGPNAKYLWECEKGHQWLASWSSIMHGHWCPTEGRIGSEQNFVNKVRDIEEKTGIRCLSDTFPNAITPLIWECSCGHIWKASIITIRNGRLCPYDAKQHVKEEQKLTEEDLTFLRNKYPNMGGRVKEFLEKFKIK